MLAREDLTMCSPRLPRLWTLVDLLRDLGTDLPTIPMPRVRTRWAAAQIAWAACLVARHPLPPRQRPPVRVNGWIMLPTIERSTGPRPAA